MPRNEEFDWIFDFVLQFLESDKFDAAVMDFVDEKCHVFEDTEENKFIYSDIHKEFCDHIEALITSNLSELGITNELFLESCEKARDGRDINTTVFERLTAMDDFQTFKKIMTKRNTELQLESIQSMNQKTPMPPKGASAKNLSMKHRLNSKSREDVGVKSTASSDGFALSRSADEPDSPKRGVSDIESAVSKLLNPEQLQALKDSQNIDLDAYGLMDEEDIQELLLASLMEMELIHRQEELEHAELERALQLSLAMEEQRLRTLMADSKASAGEEGNSSGAAGGGGEQEEGASSVGATGPDDSKLSGSSGSGGGYSKDIDAYDAKGGRDSFAALQTHGLLTTSDPKPLKPLKSATGELKPLPSMRSALPSIGTAAGAALGPKPLAALDARKREIEDTIKKSQDQLAEKRRQEEQLRQQLAGIDPVEAARRAEHMKRQRELIVAKKKAEREQKVRAEEERTAKRTDENREVLAESLQRLGAQAVQGGAADSRDAKDGPSEEEIAEMRRSTMRTALARRMKMDLIENEEAKISELQEEQFSQLDKKLREVEKLREDNRKREYILAKQLERQQALIARNVRQSAQELGGGGGENGDDF